MRDIALLLLRLTTGGFLAGHGAQKLFGSFGGYGVQGTAGWLESMGMRPGRPWALAAGLSEFGGGLLMLVGFLNPLGPLGALGSMLMATVKVHWGKPLWVTSGGPELPLTNIAVALALAFAGPGRFSIDGIAGLHLPRRLLLLVGTVPIVAAVGAAVVSTPEPPEEAEREAGGELQAGEEAAHPV